MPDGTTWTLAAYGSSESAGSAGGLHSILTLHPDGTSASLGTALLLLIHNNTLAVTQFGVMADHDSVTPLRVTQAGFYFDATREVPLNVTQAAVMYEAYRVVPLNTTTAGVIFEAPRTVPLAVSATGILIEALYERLPDTYNCWEFHVYDRWGHHLVYLDMAFNGAYLEQLSDCGGGSFTLPIDDPKATPANLAYGNIVRIKYRNVDVGAFYIEDVKEVLVSAAEGGGRLLAVTGRGLLGFMEKALVYPADLADPKTTERAYEGVTKASIFHELYAEFTVRGGGDYDFSFTTEVDSAGLPWADAVTLKFKAGQTLLDVMRNLSGLGMEFTVDPWRMCHAWLQAGKDRTAAVVFRKGKNIIDSGRSLVGVDLGNVVLGEGQEQIVESLDTTSMLAYGRREMYLSVGNTDDALQVGQANALLLAAYKSPRTAITLEVICQDLFPFFDYDLGDLVRVEIPGEISASYRILSIAVKEGQGPCDLRAVLELNDLDSELLLRLDKAFRSSLTMIRPQAGASSNLATSSTAPVMDVNANNLNLRAIKDLHISFGTAIGDVNAADIPILDVGNYYGGTVVEDALQEVGFRLGTLAPLSGDSLWQAKGDLAVGTAAHRATRLPVGSVNDYVLLVDNTAATGIRWGQAPGGSINMDDIHDVALEAVPADKEIFSYKLSTDQWINRTAAELGLSETSHTHSVPAHTHTQSQITDLDHNAVKLQGRTLASTAPGTAEVIGWDGAQWKPMPLSEAGTIDAGAVMFTPAVNANWTGGVDPGQTDDALNQLASRTKTLEGAPPAHVHDAGVVTFTPATLGNWAGTADPGDTDDALNQLASRVKTVEVAPLGHTVYDEGVAVTQRTTLNFVGVGVTVADTAGTTTVTIPGPAAGGFIHGIYVYDSAGAFNPLVFGASSAGLGSAFGSTSPGDLVVLPAGTIVSNGTVPSGVQLKGLGRRASALQGIWYMTDGAVLESLAVIGTANDATKLVGVWSPGYGTAWIEDCLIQVTQLGTAGTGYALGHDYGVLEVSNSRCIFTTALAD